MSLGTAGLMGRKKLQKDDPEIGTIVVRGSRSWYEWVAKFAKFRRLKITDLVDQALIESAEKHGFDDPAPER
jgi:hypothetical protein